MRLWLSLNTEPDIKNCLKTVLLLLQKRISSAKMKARLTPAEQLHITLAFLGEVKKHQLNELKYVLKKITDETSSFNLDFNSLTSLNKKQTLIMLKGQTNREYDQLQKNLLGQIYKIKILASSHPPHLTLIRFKPNYQDSNKLNFSLPQIKPLTFRITGLSLMLSQLKPDGPIYTNLNSWNFKKEKFRRNVIVCLINQKGHLLLIKHQDRPLSWQFPQGGLKKSENIAVAAFRELAEETGINTSTCLLVKPNFYRYRWPNHLLLKGRDPEKKQYVGQIQSLVVLKTTGSEKLNLDKREAIKALWIKPSELLTKLPRARQAVGRLILNELKKLSYET